MLRSNFSSCNHDFDSCKCNVISEPTKDNWRTMALSIMLLLAHGALLLKLGAVALPACSISTNPIAAQLGGAAPYSEVQAEQCASGSSTYSFSDADEQKVYCDALVAGKTAALLTEERPNIFTQSVANISRGEDVSVTLPKTPLKIGLSSDVFENCIQNFFQLLGKWAAEWVNGPCSDGVSGLVGALETICHSPYALFRGMPLSPASQSEDLAASKFVTTYFNSVIDFLYVTAAAFVLACTLHKRMVGKHTSRESISPTIAGLCLLLLGPFVFRFAVVLCDALLSLTGHSFSAQNPVLSAAMSSVIKGGLMCSGLFTHYVPFLFGGTPWCAAIACAAQIVVSISLIFYVLACFVILGQLVYLVALGLVQTLLFTLHALSGPIVIVFASERKNEFLSSYISVWTELVLWMVAWAMLISCMKGILFSDIDPLLKGVLSMCALQIMVLVPHILSFLKLSPVSKYLAMDPVRCIATGIVELSSIVLTICKR